MKKTIFAFMDKNPFLSATKFATPLSATEIKDQKPDVTKSAKFSSDHMALLLPVVEVSLNIRDAIMRIRIPCIGNSIQASVARKSA